MATLLILDDDPGFREGLAETLTDFGHRVLLAEDLATARRIARQEPTLALAFVDLRLRTEDGLDFVRHAREHHPGLACIVLTAFASGDNTIEAMRLGAFDHLTKPVGRETLAEALTRALDRPPSAPAAPPTPDDGDLIGDSPAMREVFKRIGQAAASAVSVLVLGETGTGKELVARAIHRHSDRARAPFVAVNCAAIPAELMESELFGHEKGAFTGAIAARAGRFREADGGTLFLDEIGDMPPALQAKLLRVLQEREVTPVGATRSIPVDVRIVAATHRDLPDLVAQGRFREDLWYRLQVITLRLPPLRERTEDIPRLAAHFLASLCPPGQTKTLSRDALAALQAHLWPGNVRELRNALARAAVLTPGSLIQAGTLGLVPAPPTGNPAGIDWDGPLEAALAHVERTMLARALAASGGNRSEAARRLGLHRQQLYRRLAHHGMIPPGDTNGDGEP